MGTVASQITSLTIVYTAVYSDADQSKHQSSASLAFVWGIHRGPVNSPHKCPVTRKMFPFDDVIMINNHGVYAWWRDRMETFSALLALYAGNSPVTGEFPSQRPVTASFDVFLDPHLNKRLRKQSMRRFFRGRRTHYDVTVMCIFHLQYEMMFIIFHVNRLRTSSTFEWIH